MPERFTPELFDVVELLIGLPEKQLQPGMRGAIVEAHPEQRYEVEFTNEQGETTALTTIAGDQCIVVWRARTKTWVTLDEKIAAVVAYLSEETRLEVFDFARFVYGSRKASA